MGPVARFGTGFGVVEVQAKVEQPFVDLVRGAVGEAGDEAVGLGEHDLGGTDYDAADRGMENHLAGEGVEGHLVGRFELIEVVFAGGRGGGFVIHDVEVVVEGNDPIEVAAEEVGDGRVGRI